MKTVTTLLTLMAGAGLALAQTIHTPGQVTFENTESQRLGVPSHLVTNVDGTLLINSTAVGSPVYVAELYYGTAAGSLTPLVSSISAFKQQTTATPGAWSGSTQVFPGGLGGVDINSDGSGEAGDGSGAGAGYFPLFLQIKVWNQTLAATYEAAGGIKGASAVFSYVQRGSSPPSTTDTQMIRQPSFQLVPEPSAIALSVMGVAGLLLIRRRK